MRLIDADVLTERLNNAIECGRRADMPTLELEAVLVDVQNAPSIDIVRCAECKYWRNTDAEKIPTASIACGNMHADDFCSYGEREGE